MARTEDRGYNTNSGSVGSSGFSVTRDWQYAIVREAQESFLKHV